MCAVRVHVEGGRLGRGRCRDEAGAREQQHRSIPGTLGDRRGSDEAARADPVLDNDSVAEAGAKLRGDLRAMMSVRPPAENGTTIRISAGMGAC